MVIPTLFRLLGCLFAQAPLCLVERISGDRSYSPVSHFLWDRLGVIFFLFRPFLFWVLRTVICLGFVLCRSLDFLSLSVISNLTLGFLRSIFSGPLILFVPWMEYFTRRRFGVPFWSPDHRVSQSLTVS